VDDEEAQAVRAEGLDPDDRAGCGAEAPTTIVPAITVLTAWCDLEVAHRDCDQLGGGHQQWAVDK